MPTAVIAPKKLIEVALPLDAINKACAREKSIRHGHPSTLHLWWARRPLAAARAVLFAQLVNDPSWKYSDEELRKNQVKGAVTKRRNELFKLITELVQWENTTNEDVLQRARKEIRASWKETCDANKNHPEAGTLFDPNKTPTFHDPFAGGGAIPLEAQRLGLEAHASDLNPVAVLINKAMIEVPAKFANRRPIGPVPAREKQTSAKAVEDWSKARGLAEDVRRYGAWVRAEAEKRIGKLYPKVDVTRVIADEKPELKPLVGQKLTVIAWVWARTVRSPNPAYSQIDVPLVSSFLLASKPGKGAWVQPIVEKDGYRFEVRSGTPPSSSVDGTRAGGRGGGFLCVMSGSPITGDYIKAEGQAGRLGVRLMAMVAEGDRSRVYLSPNAEAESIALGAQPTWRPAGDVPARLTGGTCVPYGLTVWGHLFSSRQLVALTTFSDLVQEVAARCRQDSIASGIPDDDVGLGSGGTGARAYAESVSLILAFVVDKCAEALSTICTWSSAPKNELVVSTFRRQALPMTWDWAESNPFADSSGSFEKIVAAVARVCDSLPATAQGAATQADAQTQGREHVVVSTDPPYYDNIAYADLSDFFYVWLRRTLRPVFPELLATIAVPKAEELVASAYRHGGRDAAETFFLDGMTSVMSGLAGRTHQAMPVTVYYAFKQSDTKDDGGTSSTGWETFLQAMLNAGFGLTGTWPMRTERDSRWVRLHHGGENRRKNWGSMEFRA